MSRWIIVSNRLPFSYDEEHQKLTESSGGLVTAIKGIQTSNEVLWIGSLPDNVPRDLVKQTSHDSQFDYSFPELESELYGRYYNNFCNDVLWPILHYETELVKYNKSAWEDYKKVNRIFAEHIAQVSREGDLIWLHDFHLFMVPQYLKEINPNLNIGFFLHVPFPSSEVYRQLPCREDILRSLIHCDLLGFHDYSYLRHFASSIYNLLGIPSSLHEIDSQYNRSRLGVFPVSIDTQAFHRNANSQETNCCIMNYELDRGKRKYILGVDRLDYTKGLLFKLQAFELFLERNPSYIGKVQLIQIAVPSRTDVPEYMNLRAEVEQLVSKINGRFSHINYIPVKYIFNSVNTHELMALYRSSQVLFVSSKRDGMNLVCLEYIAAQEEIDPGVVLLSEFTGAASTLSHATIINPWDTFTTAEKIKESLEMTKSERSRRHHIMFNYLKGYTATEWATSFIKSMQNSSGSELIKTINLNEPKQKTAVKNLLTKKRPVLMVDFDGTLSPIVNNPGDAKLPQSTSKLLKTLHKKNHLDIVIVSGRSEEFLSDQFKDIDCYLACEHGAKFFDFHQNKWRDLVTSKKEAWFSDAQLIIEEFCKRTPNSFMEKKTYGIAWHYRNSPVDFGEFQARKLVMELEASLAHQPVSVILGKKVVEVKSLEANKGYFAQWFMDRYVEEDNIVVAIGDDRTDEDLFEAVNHAGISVKVGEGEATQAKYYINDQSQVEQLITDLFQD